jgi:hypothetical protein
VSKDYGTADDNKRNDSADLDLESGTCVAAASTLVAQFSADIASGTARSKSEATEFADLIRLRDKNGMEALARLDGGTPLIILLPPFRSSFNSSLHCFSRHLYVACSGRIGETPRF